MTKLDYDKEAIITRYKNGDGLKIIAKDYNCDKLTVRKLLQENNVEIRKVQGKYNIDEKYFDEINTPNKAYILGFLFADGCNTKGNKIKLSLQEKDREILEKIRKEMNYSKPLSFYNRNNKNPKHQNVYELVIYNKYMSEQLTKLGCCPRKSLILQFPSYIDNKFMSHFIRGYFDGDGHVGETGRGAHASFTSSYDFCRGLHIFLDNLQIENKLVRLKSNELTGVVRITKKEEVRKLMEYMYKDADLYMERKYSIFLEKFNNIENK